MRRYSLISCMAGTIAVTACAPDVPDLDYDIEVTELSSTVFHTGDHLGGPTGIDIVAGRLLLLDTYADRGLHVVSLDDGSRIASVGALGDGPGEFRQPVAITVDPDGNPWISDLGLQRMTRVDLDRLGDGTAWAADIVNFENVPYVVDVVWTADNTLLAGGMFSDARFGIVGRDGRLAGLRSSFPVLDRDLPPAVVQQIFQPEIATKPDMSAIVVAARWDHRIDVLDADGGTTREFRGPIAVDPVPDLLDKRGMIVGNFDRSRAAYLSVATTDDHIFALFSARTATEWKDRQLFGRDVHVFDWEGRLVSVLRLDRDALVLTVDPERGRLLTVEFDPVPAILSYDLPVLPVVESPARVAGIGQVAAGGHE